MNQKKKNFFSGRNNRFTIRKLTIGVVSFGVGCMIMMGGVNNAYASEALENKELVSENDKHEVIDNAVSSSTTSENIARLEREISSISNEEVISDITSDDSVSDDSVNNVESGDLKNDSSNESSLSENLDNDNTPIENILSVSDSLGKDSIEEVTNNSNEENIAESVSNDNLVEGRNSLPKQIDESESVTPESSERETIVPKQGEPIPEGIGFRAASTPVNNIEKDKEGFKQLGRFSNKPGLYYTQDAGGVLVTGAISTDTSLIYEIDTVSGTKTVVSTDLMDDGKTTLLEHAKQLSLSQGFSGVDASGKSREGSVRIQSLGLSQDGRYAYSIAFTSNMNVVDRTTIQGIYRFDTKTMRWSLVSDSNNWEEGIANLRTNSWTAGAVNPLDGNYYFGTYTRQSDPNFSKVQFADDVTFNAEVSEKVKNKDYDSIAKSGKFEFYFRLWSYNPETTEVTNVGYFDTNFVKSNAFDWSNRYWNSIALGNDIVFDTEGNLSVILNQFDTSKYFIYKLDKSEIAKGVASNDKYCELKGLLSKPYELVGADGKSEEKWAAGGAGLDSQGNFYINDGMHIARINKDGSGAQVIYTVPKGEIYSWGDGATIYGVVAKGNVYREYYVKNTDILLQGVIGDIIDGKFISKNMNTNGKDTVVKDQSVYQAYNSINVPQAIRTANGKVYQLSRNINTNTPELKKFSAPEIGVVKKDDQVIKYQYQEVEVIDTTLGSVIVRYINTEGKQISTPVTDEFEVPIGTSYDTEDYRLERIEDKEDNTVYYYKELNKGSKPTNGKTVSGTTIVTYVYEKAGSVIVNYVNTNGETIKPPVNVELDVEPGTKYNTKLKDRPIKLIGIDGKQYEIVSTGNYEKVGGKVDIDGRLETTDSAIGVVEAGKVKKITYVYHELINPIFKGSVIVNYEDIEGKRIKESVLDVDNEEVGTVYETYDKKKEKIIGKDGTIYYLAQEKPKVGSAPETGKVTKEDKIITYIYEKAGSVVVKYVDEKGIEIKGQEVDVDNGKSGMLYATNDKRDLFIINGNKKYKLAELGTYDVGKVDSNGHLLSSDSIEGTVEAGKKKLVTYVYKEMTNQNATIVYYDITDPSNKKQLDVIDKITGNVGDKSTYTTKKRIRDYEKKGYELVIDSVPVSGIIFDNQEDKSSDDPTQKFDVMLKHKVTTVTPDTPENDKPKPGDPINPEDPDSPVWPDDISNLEVIKERVIRYRYADDSGIDGVPVFDDITQKVRFSRSVTIDHVTGDKIISPWKAEVDFVSKINSPSKEGYIFDKTFVPSETAIISKEGIITGINDQLVVYSPLGSVVVKYEDESGNIIAPSKYDVKDEKAGTEYNTSDDCKPSIITNGGKTYRIRNIKKGSAGETGVVEKGNKEITYVYHEVKGSVIVHYKDVAGNSIKEDVIDTLDTSLGTFYNTRDHKLAFINTETGERYMLLPNKTVGIEEGNVIEGKTEVTYIYHKIDNWIPKLPVIPEDNYPKGPSSFDSEKTHQPIHPDLSREFIPDFSSKDSNGNTLTPTDSNDLNKGYISQVRENPSKELPQTGEIKTCGNMLLGIAIAFFSGLGIFSIKKGEDEI